MDFELLFNPVRIAVLLAGVGIMLGVLIFRKWRGDHWYMYTVAGVLSGWSVYDHFITGLETNWSTPICVLFLLSFAIYLHISHARKKQESVKLPPW
jgi:hypothetical protein